MKCSKCGFENQENNVSKINGKVGEIISNGIDKVIDSFFEVLKKLVS